MNYRGGKRGIFIIIGKLPLDLCNPPGSLSLSSNNPKVPVNADGQITPLITFQEKAPKQTQSKASSFLSFAFLFNLVSTNT